MCGIFGYTGSAPLGWEPDFFTSSLSHRGPDACGWHQTDFLGFGHCRLKIVGGESGKQPIVDSDGNVLVFNGELYNFKQLAIDHGLSGLNSDSRVLFELLKNTDPVEIVKELRGMFAFVFYSRKDDSFFGARDWFGMKPFFYSKTESGIAFCSEFLPLQRFFDFKPAMENTLGYLLCSNALPGKTLCKEIIELKPGQFFRLSGTKLKLDYYFKIGTFFRNQFSQQVSLEDCMSQTCLRHEHQSKKAALCLSTGLDSGSIALSLSKLKFQVDCYGLGYDDSAYDESADAKRYSDWLGFDFHRLAFEQHNLNKGLKEILDCMDGPFGDVSFYPTWMLARRISKEHKVVFSGDGGDEIFYGYPTFFAEGIWQNIPNLLKLLLIKIAGFLGKPSKKRVGFREKLLRLSWGGNHGSLKRHFMYMSSGCPKLFKGWEKLVDDLLVYAAEEDVDICNPWALVFWFYFRVYLANQVLVKTDRAFMSASVEARNPFLDIDFLCSVFSFPKPTFPIGESPKQPLRKFLSSNVPKDLLSFKKKGFSAPVRLINQKLKGLVGEGLVSELHHASALESHNPYLFHNILVYLYFYGNPNNVNALFL
jgi:asparagine synthase (glutamine-hydrolysing)